MERHRVSSRPGFVRLWNLCLAFLALSSACAAKPMRNSPEDAIQRSDLIVIGDLISGERRRHEGVIDCRAKVRIARTLKGSDGFVGQPIPIHWQYQQRSDQPPDVAPAINPVHAIWFLKGRDNSEYEAMWVALFQQPMGGYFLPIPVGKPRAPLSYTPGADYQRKVAGELAWAMQTLAGIAGDRLDWVNRKDAPHKLATQWFLLGPTTVTPQVDQIRQQFDSLAEIFKRLDPSQIQDVSDYLVQRPQIHLKVLGLLGELRAKNVDALLTMESIYPQLQVTWASPDLAMAASAIDIGGSSAAIQAVGRMCVSDVRNAAFEYGAVNQLAHTRNRTAVPYLETMLLHPLKPVRTSAARGICTAFAFDPVLRPTTDSQLIAACGLATVVANRIGNHGPNVQKMEEVNGKALRSWLTTHSTEIREATGAEPPPPPSWFTDTASAQ